MRELWLWYKPVDIETELRQIEDEGKEIPDALRKQARDLMAANLDSLEMQEEVGKFFDATVALPTRPDYFHQETFDDAKAFAMSFTAGIEFPDLDRAALPEKLHGAWLGRCCGCLLGKPVEGWHRDRLHGYLREIDDWPLDAYMRSDGPLEKGCFIDQVDCMPEDDDLNYTVSALAMFKKHGYELTASNVADFWMANIPILHTCTAERVAYRNLTNGLLPPASAMFRNPYREWIGAQIRADFWGYAFPGRPGISILFAWRDACISHVKNGIFGAMWSAAMNSAAFVLTDSREVVEAGLAYIPKRCRLAEGIRTVIDWKDAGMDYDAAVERLHQIWDEKNAHHWCHTISNACVVTIGLLWGERDFGLSICRAVQACFDTDCNGATVGSIMGAMVGVPERWSKPLNDTLETGVAGYHRVKISDLVQETLTLVQT